MPDAVAAGHPSLTNWVTLNNAMLRAGEKECHELLAIEQANLRRKNFLLRIHSRINRLRAVRERRELLKRKRA